MTGSQGAPYPERGTRLEGSLARALLWPERLLAFGEPVLRRPLVQALVVFIFLAAPTVSFFDADPDLFARVAVGRLIAGGGLPLQDPFAYSPKNPVWYDHEWLSGVVLYHLSQIGGDALLFIFKFSLWLLTVYLLARAQALLCERTWPRLLWLLLTCLWCGYVWGYTVRSQVFTYLALSALLYAFAAALARADFRCLLPAPILFIPWANLHGGFTAGLGLFLCFCVGLALQRSRLFVPAVIVFSVSCLATLINPYGAAYLRFVAQAVTMERPRIIEWQAIEPASLFGIVLLAYGAMLVWLAVKRPDSFSKAALPLLFVSYCYAWKHARLLAVFMMSAAVFGVAPFSALPSLLPPRVRQPLVTALQIAALWLLLFQVPLGVARFAGVITGAGNFSLRYHNYPVAAIEWLYRQRPGGKLLVEYKYGSYALWRLYPRFLVSIDGRYEEVYPQRTADLAHAAFNFAHPEHEAALTALRPDYILGDLQHQQQGGFGPEWHLLYKDGQHVIYGRAPNPENRVADTPGRTDSVWSPRF